MDREQRQKPKERRKGKLERSIAQGTSETERKSGNGKRCPLGVHWPAMSQRTRGTGARKSSCGMVVASRHRRRHKAQRLWGVKLGRVTPKGRCLYRAATPKPRKRGEDKNLSPAWPRACPSSVWWQTRAFAPSASRRSPSSAKSISSSSPRPSVYGLIVALISSPNTCNC